MPRPSFPVIARAAGYAAVAAVIVATVMHVHWHWSKRSAGTSVPAAADNPLAAELARCRSIGTAAQDDPSCEAAWAENRRRFFGGRPATGQD